MTWFHKTGSLSEYVAVEESVLAIVPPGLPLTHAEAASIPLVADSARLDAPLSLFPHTPLTLLSPMATRLCLCSLIPL